MFRPVADVCTGRERPALLRRLRTAQTMSGIHRQSGVYLGLLGFAFQCGVQAGAKGVDIDGFDDKTMDP